MRSKRFTKVTSVALLVILIITTVSTAVAATGTPKTTIIGTNLALGSPLLDTTNFDPKTWNKWEMVAFGVFLSNFAYPLVDDYKSAFTACNEGTKGSGLKALQFGSGNDPSTNDILKEMVNYAVAVQSSTLKPIKYRSLKDDNSGLDEYKDAVFEDLFLYNKLGWLEKLVSGQVIAKVGDWGLTGPSRFIYNEFVVEIDGGTYQRVFSYDDGWDLQMLAAWLTRVFSGEYSGVAKSNFEKFRKSPLFLDAFGNIVVLHGGRPYIVFPAAASQYITQTKQYNLLQSVLFNGNYLPASGESIINNGVSENTSRGGGGPLSGTTDFGVGKVVVSFDTDILLMEKAKQKVKISESGVPGSLVSWLGISVPSVAVEEAELGNAVDNVMAADINSSRIPFRVEIIRGEKMPNLPDAVKYLAKYVDDLASIYPVAKDVPILNYINTNNGKLQLFSNPVVTSVTTTNPLEKRYINKMYESIYGGGYVQAGSEPIDYGMLRAGLQRTKTWMGLGRWAYVGKYDNIEAIKEDYYSWMSMPASPILKAFLGKEVGVKQGVSVPSDVAVADLGRYYNILSKDQNNVVAGKVFDLTESEVQQSFRRIIKGYPISREIEIASNILGVRQGTEFALWSPFIYATYLNWYGITSDGGHKFNTKLFSDKSDILKFDMEKVSKGLYLTEEEKKKEVLNYTYMMLHPTAGREYRARLIMDAISDWIYRTYQNIVYGGVTQYYSGSYGNIGTRSANGFLHINSYSDNFMTKWFINKYVEYIVIILGICAVMIILIGILTQKKLIWFLASLFIVVNVCILMPSIGDVTPYVADSAVQNMFKDKMSYWAMSEAIRNNEIEQNANNKASAAEEQALGSDVDAKKVANLVRMLNISYLDRALMLKLDISKKINETQLENFDEIQKLQSARWLLPILMRQFTANDRSPNYIYVPLGDEYINMSNLYCLYVPSDIGSKRAVDAANDAGAAAATNEEVKSRILSDSQKTALFADYTKTSFDSDLTNGRYNTIVISSKDEDYRKPPGWESVSRIKDDSQLVHTSSYLLADLPIPSRKITTSKGKTVDGDWELYLKTYKDKVAADFARKANELEEIAGSYNSFDSSTVQEDYGYLWTTQNPLHYFYQVIKDTMRPDANVALIAGELQGEYRTSSLTGKEERVSFMHYKDTGKIRDFLDMEELFTNVIPYLYQVQILAGGFDGTSGALGDAKIERYTLYKNNYKSWMFRSNWATKLMESPLLTSGTTVRDGKGNKYYVENPMLPSCYPKERPMVFSEAQMYAMGLSEGDLSIPEVKIIKVGKAVERRWTLLLNYVNVPGVTPDILYKQMALDALLEFNREFSSGNFLNPAWNLYPMSIDLRALSFDSVMKMLMLNNTKDVRYIYGDTMKNIIESSDIFSALLLLLSAFLCAYVIPFVRDVALGLLFYLGFWAVITNILSAGKTKLKITAAFAINNIAYLIMTLAYYQVFAVLINLTYSDNILNVKDVTINTGSPVWVFIIIIIASGLYIWGTWRLIRMTILNYRDLGFEVYATWAGVLATKIQDKIGEIGSTFREAFGGFQSGSEEAGTGSTVGEGASVIGKDVKVKVEVDGDTTRSKDKQEVRNEVLYRDSGYIDDVGDDDVEIHIDIDKEIEKGKRIE